nr:hypothetical protein [Tanacetum cinerariifolium]
MRHRFDLGYKIWVYYGEPDLPLPPQVIDNTRQPQMSDVTTLLNDLCYIPPNNEHNEPTQGDIGETSNEPTQDTRNKFKELYASANEELYPGCDYVTRLDFMGKFTYFKVKGKLTDSIFNEMFEFLQNVFPISKGYKLPPSYYAIKKTFKMIGLGYKSIHACENDCCLFWGDDKKDLDFCPLCNMSRWKDSNTPGKTVPKKVLRYFLIIPRLQRLYKSSHTIKEIIWHATGKCTEPDKMQHPVDGLAVDGFNPFGNLSQAYNMRPVILTTYNLPLWLCMKESSFMLTLLIPDPKSPSKDIDVYLRPLIEDLKFLRERKGFETIDVASGQKFNMRAMVLWTINDFPDRSSLSGDHPKEFGQDKILTQLDRLPTRVKGKHPSYGGVKIKRNVHDDMLKAQIKVVNILCDLELIYPPDLFDIMIYLVIYLPLEALKGGPIRPWRVFPFEKYMKKVKGYVQNKAKPEGSIAKGYVLEEALTFISNYFQDVTMKFNRPDRNVDPPPPTCQFQVFRSEYIIDVVDENNDIIDDEDALSHDLADSDDEDLINVDDDGVDKMSADVVRSHDGDGGGEDRPPPHYVPTGCEGCFANRDGQSTEVEAPPYIIDVVEEDEDIIDDEDALPHDLADSDDEDLINVDDDGVDKMSADVAWSHDDDGGGEDRPPPYYVPIGCEGCFANREIPKVMKIFFEQHIAKEEAFTKYIRDKIADVKASLTRVRIGICEMENKSDKDAWKDAIDCFKETELKLSRLTQLANKNFDGVKELKVHFAIMDLRKVIIMEESVRQALHLDVAESIDCLPNKEIFAQLARMGSSMASVVICLATSRKFNCSKYIFECLVRNVDSSSKFCIYPRFLQLMMNAQIADFSSYTTKYTSPDLTQKVIANMRRVGKGFSRVDTPLFEGMMVPQQDADDVADVVADNVAADVVAEDEDASRQGGVAKLDEDKDITLEEVAAEVSMNAKIQGRQEQSQAAARRRKGVVIRDPEEISTPSIIVHSEPKAKDKGKGILVEEAKPFKKQAHIEQYEAYAIELKAELNANIN